MAGAETERLPRARTRVILPRTQLITAVCMTDGAADSPLRGGGTAGILKGTWQPLICEWSSHDGVRGAGAAVGFGFGTCTSHTRSSTSRKEAATQTRN